MPSSQIVVTTTVALCTAPGPQHVVIKNRTKTGSVFLNMGESKYQSQVGGAVVATNPIADATCYEWEATDSPLTILVPDGVALTAFAPVSQTVHVLIDRK